MKRPLLATPQTSWNGIFVDALTKHVVPVDDLRPHEFTSKCWCRPDVEYAECDASPLECGIDGISMYEYVLHNSMDGREKHQTEAQVPLQ